MSRQAKSETGGSSADTSARWRGMTIGRYEIVRKLATGGMAELFLVRQKGIEGFEKLVALKRILPMHAGDPDFLRMFLDEARLAATLDHPHVVTVFDIGLDGDDPFFTMEYIHGTDVGSLVRAARVHGVPIPLEQAVTIASAVASGLHYAHERRDESGRPLELVHRDVSPTNVLVSYDGAVKVVDFGIAKAAATTGATRAGMRKGKFAYMSPEQCRADPIDRRSDVFSLGILLYEMTTLSRCFDGDNEFAIMNRIITRDAELPSLRCPGYPPELERIVMRALARDRLERHPTARELGAELVELARRRGLVCAPGPLGELCVALLGRRPHPAELDAESAAAPPAPLLTHVLTTDQLPATAAKAFVPAAPLAAPLEEDASLGVAPTLVRGRSPHRRPWAAIAAALSIAGLSATAWWLGRELAHEPRAPAVSAPSANSAAPAPLPPPRAEQAREGEAPPAAPSAAPSATARPAREPRPPVTAPSAAAKPPAAKSSADPNALFPF